MSVTTLTAEAAVTLPPPSYGSYGARSYHAVDYAVVPGTDEIAVLSTSIDGVSTNYLVLGGYNLDGSLVSQNLVGRDVALGGWMVFGAGADSGLVAVTYTFNRGADYLAIYNASGGLLSTSALPATAISPARGFDTSFGVHMEWVTPSQAPGGSGEWADYDTNSNTTTLRAFGRGDKFAAYADTTVGGTELNIQDNQAVLTGQAPITIPGEPAHAMSEVVARELAGGSTAAVAWVDSGTDYVSIFNASTNSFGPVIGLDWGGASDLHIVGLPDGFVVSWVNGGAYKGEVFDAAGNGGGIISLAGDVAGINSHGDLYTVGLNGSGQEVVQTYAINGGGSSGGGGTTGQTFTSDNSGDHWVGTAGNDVFNLGRGGDVVTGNGGNDTYRFAAVPWAGGHITDFNAGDVLDLTGLMSTTSDTGSDGFADGYLKITGDGSGAAQVWANYHIPGNDGWWLVETLGGVAPASVQHSGDVITVGSAATGPTDVTTSASTYTAPATVKTITLAGSQQHIDASATNGVTITSNDTGNVLVGGSGGDVFHLGRGGDWVSGGAGADTFAYAATPWAGGSVTDFNGAEGDRINVSGLLSASGYSGSDPFADGYLKYTTDGRGNAQVWSDLNLPGNDGWWLVATLDGVSTSSLHYSGGLIT
ncbi:MAG: endo,3,4-beta-glycanase, C-terminal secretion signal protein [Caulobacteraceae bacterium]|nr:endo,3,4-beta-glycanase, C-terminal secretion signal protein [Caulobacteraceae bacterium]